MSKGCITLDEINLQYNVAREYGMPNNIPITLILQNILLSLVTVSSVCTANFDQYVCMFYKFEMWHCFLLHLLPRMCIGYLYN